MSKRPAFQFYPADWRKEAGLRLCTAGARALWIDMLCLMHEADPYGHLTVLGKAMAPEALAKLVGEGAASVKRWIVELETNEVFSRTEDGVIFSRRMVRDERLREIRANGGQSGANHGAKGALHGHKGGRPRKDEGGSGDDGRGDKKPPLKPPPSSSSSSSASQSSEDKSSDASGGLAGDPDRDAWTLARALLQEQGGLSAEASGKFFGKLLSDHGLLARDMFSAVAGGMSRGTQDPRSYLVKAAVAIAGRRPNTEPKRVGFV